jgi:hypothetical protein
VLAISTGCFIIGTSLASGQFNTCMFDHILNLHVPMSALSGYLRLAPGPGAEV